MTSTWEAVHAVLVAAVAAVAAFTTITGSAVAQGTSRPNVLLLYVDDLRHDGLGATGHPFVETPNVDKRIAGQGVNFRNSFVTCPLCSPSRASLMTGQYAATHGYYGNDRLNAVPDERLPLVQTTLRSAGYRTGLIGKWHMDSYFEPRAGFDYWAAFQGQGVHTNPQLRVKQDTAPVRTVNETGFTTTILTDYALDFLKDYGAGGTRSEPFALTLSFKAVHAPVGPQYTASGDLYAGQPLTRPPNAAVNYGGYDINGEKPVFSRPGFSGLTLNNTKGNSDQLGQMAMMHDIDTNIGRVLDALEAKGLDKNTLVIFTSDNGFFWGEHGRGDKRLAYEESIRVPLLMRGPGITPGKASDAMVTNVDLAPTILTAAGLGVPRVMQGRPLNGVLSGSAAAGRDAIYAEYYKEDKYPDVPSWEAVRTKTHLLLSYPDLGPQYDELYDVAADPYEMNNLLQPGPTASLPPATRTVLDEMQSRLFELRREADGVNPFTRQITIGSRLDFTAIEGGTVQNDPDTSRVGADTSLAGVASGRSAVLAYELPRLEDPTQLARAFVSFNIVRQTGNVSLVNADLWAIGITSGSTRLAEHLEANTELNLADRSDNLKLQDNIITMGNHLSRTFSNETAAGLLAGYLRTFYTSHPGYAGGSFLQVRLNPDRDLGATSAGWDISAMDAPTSATDPTPFYFRQPGLVYELTVDRSVITIDVTSGLQTQSQAGYPVFSGTTPLLKTGTGTLVIDRARTLTGSCGVQKGRLQIAAIDALLSSRVVPLAGGTVTVSPGLSTVVGGLAASAGGVTDVGTGSMTVSAGMSRDDLLAALRAGRGAGSWSGTTGITSSGAAASGGTRTVGWLDHGNGSVTFAYAAAGDTNLDWTVDIIDIANLLAGGKLNTGLPATWNEGDFNYDGSVDVLDVAELMSTGLYAANTYNEVPSSVVVAPVPEPCPGFVSTLAVMPLIRVMAAAARRLPNVRRPKDDGSGPLPP
ncbi:MAG: sulfatase-like hydrolase/transferase [Planctomycetaceae bacterium]